MTATTGTLDWAYTTDAQVFSSPAVANGVVYVGSGDGNLYTFDLAGGTNARPETEPRRPAPELPTPPDKLPNLTITPARRHPTKGA